MPAAAAAITAAIELLTALIKNPTLVADVETDIQTIGAIIAKLTTKPATVQQLAAALEAKPVAI